MPLKSWSEMMKDSETSTPGFQPLEPNSYDFVIEKPAEVGETNKGYPKFTFYATVESGPRKDARQRHVLNASENTFAMKNYFFKPLYAIGITPEFLASDPTNEQIANAFAGKRFSARVQKQKDSDFMELVDFAPGSGVAPVGNQPGVPTGIASAASAPQAPAAPAPAPVQAPQAPVQAAQPAAPPAHVPDQSPAAPAAPANDGNPWASSPPPPPVF